MAASDMKGQKDPPSLEHPPSMETCVAMAKHRSMDSLPEWSKGVDSSSTGANHEVQIPQLSLLRKQSNPSAMYLTMRQATKLGLEWSLQVEV